MKTGDTEHIDPAGLTAWFSEAQPGATLVYARGDLGRDRGTVFCTYPPTTLDSVARQVWNWQHKGFVFLLQRRVQAHRYAYMAVRASANRKDIAHERASLATLLGMMADTDGGMKIATAKGTMDAS